MRTAMAILRMNLILLLILFGPAAGRANATDARVGCAPRPQDSLWMIGTRHLDAAGRHHPDIEQFRYWRYEGAHWRSTSAFDLLEDTRQRTVIYVHGNRIDSGAVFQRGWDAYRALTRDMEDPASIRFIVWSWPSDRLCGPRRDARVKAARTDIDGYYLATLLMHLPPETPLGMFGFSLGGRIISGALHVAGGGTLCGYRLPAADAGWSEGPGVALMALAMDRTLWLPGGAHSQSPAYAGSLLLQYNSCDPVLKLYPRVDHRGAQALGYTGFPWPHQLDANAAKLEQQNVCCYVGRTHEEHRYFASSAIMSQVRRHVLGP
jgi:hypothetical protein